VVGVDEVLEGFHVSGGAYPQPCGAIGTNEGDMKYNSGNHVYQYCNGANWVPVATPH